MQWILFLQLLFLLVGLAVIVLIMKNVVEVFRDEIVINSNKQSKAALIGRDKVRLIELSKIIKDFFGKSLKIVWFL